MSQHSRSSCRTFCQRACFCLFIPALLCTFVAIVGYYGAKPCDTELLADVDNSTFVAGSTRVAGQKAAGTCTMDLTFDYDQQPFNATLSTLCNSCGDLLSPPGSESVKICFRQAPTDPGIRIIQNPESSRSPEHTQWQWRVGLGIVGVIAAVSLAAILIMAIPWSSLCSGRRRQFPGRSSKQTKKGWSAFHDQSGGPVNMFDGELIDQHIPASSGALKKAKESEDFGV